MTPKELRLSATLEFLRAKKIVTLIEVMSSLNCSRRTAQKRLAEWRALSSYNRNASYYTLPDIPEFDANGLWRYQGVFFSKFGTLPATFIGLVTQSSAGLTTPEAGALLGVRPNSFLSSLQEHPALKREKYQKRYVYFSSAPERYLEQMEQRRLARGSARTPTDSEAVAILVEKIKQPSLSDKELSQKLERQKVFIEPDIIHDFFLHHNLTEKKTPRSI